MLIQFALTLTVLLAFCGLALDVGYMELTKLKLQNAADAAALGALNGAPSSTALQVGRADAALNGFTDGTNGTTVNIYNPPTSGTYAGNSLAYQAVVTQTYNPFFFTGARTLTAQSIAAGVGNGCAWFLHTKSSSSTHNIAALSSSSIQSSCPIYLNCDYWFYQSSGTGGPLYEANPSPDSSCANFNYPAPSPAAISSTVQSDPLGSLQPPTPGVCTSSPAGGNISTTTTLSQGTYCNGLSISGAQVTFNPGTYIIEGTFSATKDSNTHVSSTLIGNNVTFYMTKNASNNYGTFTIDTSKANLSAPTSGSLLGILVFTDRSMTPQDSHEILFNNLASGSTLDGILYAPGEQVFSSGGGTLQSKSGGYFSMVADDLLINGTNVNFSSNYPNGNPFQAVGRGLVQ